MRFKVTFFDVVNVLKGKLWDDRSEFDQEKDKNTFRDYEGACDRVKNFYKEQHGELPSISHFRTQNSSFFHGPSV